jgi:hypothetical protein
MSSKPSVVHITNNFHAHAGDILQESVERCELNNWHGVVVLGYSRDSSGRGLVEVQSSDFLSTDQVLGAIERAKFEILIKIAEGEE